MKFSLLKKLLLASTLVFTTYHALAEDIDLYQANSSTGTSNLLVVFDNSASGWSSSATYTCPYALGSLSGSGGGVQACGMWRAVDTIGTTPSLLGKLNMGIMMLSAPPTKGGTFRFPATARPSALPNMNAAGIAAMKASLTSMVSTDKSSSRDVGGSTWEAWAFYAGKLGASGSPAYPGITSDDCGKNFVIRVGVADNNSNPADSSSNSADVLAALGSAGATAAQQQQINWTTDNKFVGRWGDEWARFMKQNNAIATYTITLVDTGATDTTNKTSYIRFMKSVADVSGGKAFVVDLGDINGFVQALLAIFNEVQAVNSVFAAASLPISVNAQGTFLNQIYFGMFRPDAGGLPRWAGNLKQYQFVLDQSDPLNSKLFLADSLGKSAINSAGTGFFSPNAVSFWTTKNTATLPDSIDPTGALGVNSGQPGGFFIFNPQGAISSGFPNGFDLPDGEIVEKGGVAQRIRLENLNSNYATAAGTSTNPRRMYTCTSGTTVCATSSSLSATPFALSNDGITAAALGSGTAGTPVSSITRNGSVATVTLSSAMSPVLAGGQTVTLTGASDPAYVGAFVVNASPTPTATVFTIPVTVSPPTSSAGTYSVSLPGSGRTASSITRINDTTARVNLSAHGFVLTQQVAISSAGAGFDNAGATITNVVDANNFDYLVTIGPASPGGGGTVLKVGDPAGNIRTIAASPGGIIRNGSPAATSPFSDTVTVTATANLPASITVGSNVTISTTTPTAYNGVRVVTGVGAACPNGGTNNRKFCFTIPTTPAASASGGATVASTGISVGISSLIRPITCTGATPTPVGTITATTSAAHGFVTGQTVGVAGTGPSVEAPFLGTFNILSVPTTTTFTYNITTTPPCSDTTAGMTASGAGADRTTLINWVRGEDNLGDEASPPGAISVRPSIHGDVLHSRPAVVNYGSPTGVVVFYGSNDGTFRAVNGNQTAAISGISPGGELWSFVAPEFFPKLIRQYLNSPVVKLSDTSSSILPTPQPKDYYFDGNVGVYQDTTAGKVIIFVTARRGGRLIYAIDVSNPADPKFLWKKTNASIGFGELGQTWSTPKVALIKGYNDGATPPVAKPVLIFGAGYDSAEDAEPPGTRTMGRGIFILDALTGAIVWQAQGNSTSTNTTCTGTPCVLRDMIYPIASDVSLIDRDTSDGNGYVDRLYVPDLGGNVWRVDLQPAVGNAPSNWQVTKFASVGGATTDTTKRKIFFPPDVVQTKTFDAVLFATGDREHPTRTQAAANIINRFYMLKDTKIGNDACPAGVCSTTITDSTSSTANAAPSGLFNASNILPATLSTTPFTPGPAYDQSGNGFYATLLNAVAHRQPDASTRYGPDVEVGEKSVNAPTTIGGTTYFGTNSPVALATPGVCQPNLGTARGYGINFVTGTSHFVVFQGGGLPPSPVSGLVTISGQTVPFLIGAGNPSSDCVGADCTSSVGGQKPPIPIAPIRSRTYWYRDVGNR